MNLNWKAKAGIIAVVLLVITALLVVIKYQRDTIAKQQMMQESVVAMKQLQDNIVRSQAEFMTKKDLETFAKSSGVDLGPIQNDVKKLGADIQGISVAVTRTPGAVTTNVHSTTSTPAPPTEKIVEVKAKCPDGSTVNCPDPYGYAHNTQVLKLNEPVDSKTQVPWGEASFSSWRPNPWDLKVSSREYSNATVMSVDEDGRHFVHNETSITVDGKKYSVPITHSEFAEEYPSAHFHWWNPKLALNLAFGFTLPDVKGDVAPGLGFSFLSYGKTKLNPDYIFLQLGAGYNIPGKNLQVMLSPVLFNLNFLPLIKNTYFGPAVGLDASQNVSLLGAFSVPM